MEEISEGKKEVNGDLDLNRSKQIAIIILIVIGTIALGCLAINQGLSYLYNSQLLLSPCEHCVEINPHLEYCINPNAPARPMNSSRSKELYGENFSGLKFTFS